MLRKRLIYMGIVPLLCCIRAGRKVRGNPAVPGWKNGRENLSKLYRKYRLRNGFMGQRAGKRGETMDAAPLAVSAPSIL